MSSKFTVQSTATWPIKSVQHHHEVPGTPHGALTFDESGMLIDRTFMLVEAAAHLNEKYNAGSTSTAGHFLSQREDPVMARISASQNDGSLSLFFEASDLTLQPIEDGDSARYLDVSVWGWDGKAIDQGDEAATWLSEIIGRPVRLARTSKSLPRHIRNDPTAGVVSFADGYPILLAGTASLDAVNQVMVDGGNEPVEMNRFRANLVIETTEPFIEDQVASLTLETEAGKVVLESYSACARCPIPDTDQVSGEVGRTVRSGLRKAKRVGTKLGDSEQGVFFGVNMSIASVEGNPRIEAGNILTAEMGPNLFVPKASS